MENLNLSPIEDNPTQSTDNTILGKILSETESQEKLATKPFKLVNGILAGLRHRERDVLLARYGLADNQVVKETLESIGKRFGVTRERVRQIENSALKKVGKKYAGQLKPFLRMINAHLSAQGGVVGMEDLANYLDLGQSSAEAELDRRALHLIMDAYDKVIPLKKYPLFKEGWAMINVDQSDLLKIQETIYRVLDSAAQALPEDDLVKRVSQQLITTDPALIVGTLRIDPKVSLDNKKYWGLTSWPLVVPKRIRDKIFLVLEEMSKPLHFEKIAQLISERYPTNKPVLSRTVHNELIGDNRFVLVGRGIYALQKWGYQPGVVADVIKAVLQKAGRPMLVTEIITEVLKSRQVKKNTIIANLQNHQLFHKVAKSTYTVAFASSNTPLIN